MKVDINITLKANRRHARDQYQGDGLVRGGLIVAGGDNRYAPLLRVDDKVATRENPR